MSKADFERRLLHAPSYIKDIYDEYEYVFSEDLISVWWYPGWSHIVEGLLKTVSRIDGAKVVKIKSHFSFLYVHYYSRGDELVRTLDYINYYCSISCRSCGNLVNLGDTYCEQCK